MTCIRAARHRPDVEGHPEILTRAKAGSRSVERASGPGPDDRHCMQRSAGVSRAPVRRARGAGPTGTHRGELRWVAFTCWPRSRSSLRSRPDSCPNASGAVPMRSTAASRSAPQARLNPATAPPSTLKPGPWTITGRWIRFTVVGYVRLLPERCRIRRSVIMGGHLEEPLLAHVEKRR